MFTFLDNSKIQSRDVVAVLALIIIFTYKALGHNGDFDSMVALIIGYYFGRRDDATVEIKER